MTHGEDIIIWHNCKGRYGLVMVSVGFPIGIWYFDVIGTRALI